MIRFIYGTGNREKIEQVKGYLEYKGIDVEILTPKDIGFNEEIIEDGSTLEENSIIKAKAIRGFCEKNNINELILTDDTGLFVKAINGEPGIYSARYAGENSSQLDKINKVLENMKKSGNDDKTAEFDCVLTLVLRDGTIVQEKGITKGRIADKIGPLGKLTYGPIFIPDGKDRCMNELTDEELGQTHREKALEKLLKYFN